MFAGPGFGTTVGAIFLERSNNFTNLFDCFLVIVALLWIKSIMKYIEDGRRIPTAIAAIIFL
jgi:hypothetical protein